MSDKVFVQVILPLRLEWEPWYYADKASGDVCHPGTIGIVVGDRVKVRFGPRTYIAVVSRVAEVPDIPEPKVLKISSVERELPRVSHNELKVWRFMADYLMCTIGEVYHQAYPYKRIAGEQTSVNALRRREELVQRQCERLSLRRDRLRERLQKKDSELQRKHGDKVMGELRVARDKILAELAAVEDRISAVTTSVSLPASSVCLLESSSSVPLSMSSASDSSVSSSLQRLISEIEACLERGRTAFLEIATGERPQLYSALAAGIVAEKKQMLLLVPEIVSSQNLYSILAGELGESRVALFNSSVADAPRQELASRLRLGESVVVLGTRSSIFLPFSNLGLVIVDNEHDNSYKQDSAPRYNARDMSAVLASLHGAGMLMTSASPSLETIYNCLGGRFERLDYSSPSYEGPRMMVIDTKVESRKNGMSGCFSRKLVSEIFHALDRACKVLVLRSWGSTDFIFKDAGIIFPDRIISGPENPDADIIISTISEAKYLEIKNLGVLCIMHPDKITARQNFRADEYAFQILESFRRGLKSDNSANPVFVIQTSNSEHPVYQALAQGEDIYGRLMDERRSFGYPPFSRLVDFVIKGRDAASLDAVSSRLVSHLQSALPGIDIQGPLPPEYESARTVLRKVRVALPKDSRLTARKKLLQESAKIFFADKNCDVHIDVDPL